MKTFQSPSEQLACAAMASGKRFASLPEALHWLASRIDYERTRWMSYEERCLHLDRMGQLLALLQHPEKAFPVVHVAGTKGKGSTSAMVAAILQTAGYKTGLFTSPHLEKLPERIRINGQMVPDQDALQLFNLLWPSVCQMDQPTGQAPPEAIRQQLPSPTGPTYFEILTAMAMLHFAQKKVQIAVFEVGLGGRLDATNLCQPIVSVITSISFDHTQLLGNTLEAIAAEKAGIVKPSVPVVSGVTQPGPREVIRQVCQTQQAPLIELQEHFCYSYQPPRNLPLSGQRGQMDFQYWGPGGPWHLEGVPLSLLGRHQAANAALALATVALLRQAGWKISEQACRQALAQLHWPARCELLPGRPALLLDTAHNLASVEALLEVLQESFVPGRRLLLFATTHDKDVAGMLTRLLPAFNEVILTNYLDNPRAMPVEDLLRLARQIGGRPYPAAASPAQAWEIARSLAQPEDLICITGSFFLIGQILPLLSSTSPTPPSS